MVSPLTQGCRALTGAAGAACRLDLIALPACAGAIRPMKAGSDLGWPVVSMVGEVCRPELLFEVELVAGPVPEKGERE